MPSPKCDVCQTDLNDWSGNVMVPANYEQTRSYEELLVWCKPCTRASGAAGRNYHNIFELSWVKNNYVHILAFFLREVQAEKKWSPQSLEKLLELSSLVFPDKTASPI